MHKWISNDQPTTCWGVSQREANEGKYLDQFPKNLNKIEQLRVEGTHKCETNEGTYLDQLNNNNTWKKKKRKKKNLYIYVYIYVQYIHSYQ